MSSPAELRYEPFPHTATNGLIGTDLADAALLWLETDALWTLRVASFYEQWEIHLDSETLPMGLAPRALP